MKMKALIAALGAVGVGVCAVASVADAATCRALDVAETALSATNNCLVNYSDRPGGYQCSGGGCDCQGSEFNDVIIGNSKGNVIIGLGGDDILVGMGGSDVICAGDGDDFVDAGDAGRAPPAPPNAPPVKHYNQVRLGAGSDKAVTGGYPDDGHNHYQNVVRGGLGEDAIVGGDGEDVLSGGDENDFLTGGDDGDQLFGGDGDDFLSGQEGRDRLDGGPKNDVCVGGAGSDASIYCEHMVSAGLGN